MLPNTIGVSKAHTATKNPQAAGEIVEEVANYGITITNVDSSRVPIILEYDS
jgi:hypothetical protein